ncbi:MAG: GNAT family N-acetyltransferase [Candidatus Binatia bacterium]
MADFRLRIRRTRRTDFPAVMGLLAVSDVALPPPDRPTLRRFRRLVGDLGADFYLALVDETLAGLIHVTYARQLTAAPWARLEQLVVATPFRRRGIGTALVAFAQRRARQRGCARLSCPLPGTASPAARLFLRKCGLHPVGEWFAQQLLVDG